MGCVAQMLLLMISREYSRSIEAFSRYRGAHRPALFKVFVAVVFHPTSGKMNSNVAFLPLHVFIANVVCIHYVLIYQCSMVEDLVTLLDEVNQSVLLQSMIFMMLDNVRIYPGIQEHASPGAASEEQASRIHYILILSYDEVHILSCYIQRLARCGLDSHAPQ
jgi:hypothetical protein